MQIIKEKIQVVYKPSRCIILILLLCMAVSLKSEEITLLGAGSKWKRHYSLFPPIISEKSAKDLGIELNDFVARSKALEGKIKGYRGKKYATFSLNMSTPVPDNNWMDMDFDDTDWLNDEASDFEILDKRIRTIDDEKFYRAAWGTDDYIKELGLISQRGKFIVKDPGKVKKLTLSLSYRGGFVAYLNGKEVARGHLPSGELTARTGAKEYESGINLGPETIKKGKKFLPKLSLMKDHRKIENFSEYWSKKERRSKEIIIDKTLLVKGSNVLAIEIHRSTYDAQCKKEGLGFGAIGMSECHLKALASSESVVSSFYQEDGIRVWNRHAWEASWNTDFENSAERLEPVKIVGARNGSFSGQVLVGSTRAIQDLKAVSSDLVTIDGKKISSESIQILYGFTSALHQEKERLWKKGYQNGARFDTLQVSAPQTVKLIKIKQTKVLSRLLGVPEDLKSVAVLPIWVKIDVPKNVVPGMYKGTLTINSKDNDPVSVPINLSVTSWTVPNIKDYTSLFFIYQSPDTLAKYFKVEPWSEEHWAMIESSLKMMGEAGNIGLIFPLQAESAMGNAESFVPWIKKIDGTYEYDFSRFDKYLELALKYHDVERLKVIAINVWGAENKREKTKTRDKKTGKVIKTYGDNPRTQITVIDKASGVKSKFLMPNYSTPEAKMMWEPILLKIKSKLEKHKLFSKAMFGMAWDQGPSIPQVKMFREILGDIPWFRESHFNKQSYKYDENDKTKTVAVGCNSIVWGGEVFNPKKKRLYGWKYNPKHIILNFNRAGVVALNLNQYPIPWNFRMWMESTISSGRNGNGRCGGDFFKANYSRGTGNMGCMFGSYSRSQVAQTGLGNNVTDLFGPGPKGPVSTIRFENALEGNQETEAKIVIEKALLSNSLSIELAKECQVLLDHRINMMRMWQIAGRLNSKIAAIGWQENNRKLFEFAAKVEKNN